MSGECNKCGEHTLECICKCFIKRIEDIGQAKEMLKNILECDLFDNLSKHNPYWESDYEVEYDKLYDLRMKLSSLEEKLLDLNMILSSED